MTAEQSFKIYEVLHRHFKNDADAKEVVKNIELIVENKFADKKEDLVTKKDLSEAKFDLLKWIIILFIPFYLALIGFAFKYFFS
ncbi:MAG: hypothetical protein JST94_04915 [Bacteroidetes bacterium]|nr:hypothetical protein [Bacteroidota bacterium]MBS1641110.1 hypothetical protein [Bacteroidota bacterium]MBS1670780.1 hypothetical protein [Bacteroidota bacterium]